MLFGGEDEKFLFDLFLKMPTRPMKPKHNNIWMSAAGIRDELFVRPN
jgi:hypothetical protein